jgi:hypothetical protein
MPIPLALVILVPSTAALGTAVALGERETKKAREEGVEIITIDATPLMLTLRETYETFSELWRDAPEILAARQAELADDKAVLAAMDASDPNYEAAQYNVQVAEENLASAQVLREHAGQARVDLAWMVVSMVGRVIGMVKRRRDAIRIGEDGLAGFDNDLAQIQARYAYVYRRYFEEMVGEVPEGAATAPTPDATNWDEEDFALLEERIVNPLLFWSLTECRDNWPEELSSVPPCEGPDLLTAWSLSNQVSAGEQHQLELLRNVFGFMQYKLEEFAEEFASDIAVIWDGLAEKAKEVFEAVKETVKKAFDAKYIVGGLVVVGVAWALGRRR